MSNYEDEVDKLISITLNDMNNSISIMLQSYDQADKNTISSDLMSHYEIMRLKNNLSQLYGLYNLENKKLTAIVSENYVDEMLFDIVADNTSICEKFNLKLEIDCPINFLWYFDKKLISGVINNALINLIRYTNSKVIISAKIESDYLQIDICDDSKGFPSQVLNEFDTVKKGDSNFSEIKLGANWYYALKILEMHENQAKKGDYSLSNNRDFEGAKIRIIIP